MSPRSNQRVLAIVRHPVGGVRTHITYTYPHLIDAGLSFTFVVPDHESYVPFVKDVSHWRDVEVVTVPFRDRKRLKPRFRQTVRRLISEKSYGLLHSHGLQAAIPTLMANMGVGLPHVMTSQDVFHRVNLSSVIGKFKLYALGEFLRHLDVLIAVSEDTRADHLHYLSALSKGPCKVKMIHNGIPIDQYSGTGIGAPANLREELSVDHEVCLIGFLGRFMEQKGYLVLCNALSQLLKHNDTKPFHLIAVGSGDMLVNYRRELASSRELSSHISYLPHVPNVAPILRELDLLAIPSLWEAHPLLPMEAMVMGVPIVGTSCLGLREVLQGSPNVMVRPGDVVELAEALSTALNYPWKDKAVAYIPKARQQFDVKKTAEQLHSLYDQVSR